MDTDEKDKIQMPEHVYRYIGEDEFKIIKYVTKGSTSNQDIYGNIKESSFLFEECNSQAAVTKAYGLDSLTRGQALDEHGKRKITLFPQVLKINVINKNSREPMKGIALGIRLFANVKNNYYYLTDPSDKKGSITVTKEMLKEEIRNTINLFSVDYASQLEDCKPYIEIVADDTKTIKERLDWMTQVAKVYEPVKRGVKIFKHCKNSTIHSSRITVDIQQNTAMQHILFEVE